jgi:hypothetical protein
MSILHHDALGVNADSTPVVSEADRRWWAEFTGSSEWWLDLAEETVADGYGEPLRVEDDDEIIDRYIGNHGYEPPPPDEFYRWGGHPG